MKRTAGFPVNIINDIFEKRFAAVFNIMPEKTTGYSITSNEETANINAETKPNIVTAETNGAIMKFTAMVNNEKEPLKSIIKGNVDMKAANVTDILSLTAENLSGIFSDIGPLKSTSPAVAKKDRIKPRFNM